MSASWIGIETSTAWVLAIAAGSAAAWLILGGMAEDLFEIVRGWSWSRNGNRRAMTRSSVPERGRANADQRRAKPPARSR